MEKEGFGFTYSVCNKCHLYFYKWIKLDGKKKTQLEILDELKCPICGAQTKVMVSNKMNIIVRKLVEKGYLIMNVYNKEMGVEIGPIDDIKDNEIFKHLPEGYKYSYDPKSKTVIIFNELLMQGNQSEDYIRQKLVELMLWVNKIPNAPSSSPDEKLPIRGTFMDKDAVERLIESKKDAEDNKQLYL